MNKPKISLLVGAALGATVGVTPVSAAVLVYEGFNGYGSSLASTKPNSNTIGLSETNDYAGTSPGNVSINAGLALGNLQVSGGSAGFTGGTIVAGARLVQANPYVGTLWGSYLVNLSARGGASGNGMEVRISSNDATENIRFRALADSRSTTTANSVRLATGYDTGFPDSGTSIALNTTYIIISRFTKVGTDLSSLNPGVGTSWALTASQFEALMSDANPEQYLLGATTAEVTALSSDTVTTGNFAFTQDNRVQFVTVADAGRVDEIRYGSSLADVTPVPEPTLIGLAGVSAALLGRRSRRRD